MMRSRGCEPSSKRNTQNTCRSLRSRRKPECRRSEEYQATSTNLNSELCNLTVPRSKHGEARHVKLNSIAMAAFESLQARRVAGENRIFTSTRTKQPLNQNRHWFDDAVDKAGILDFKWHDLRHTFASRLVMAGVDLRTVQELMGHKTIAMTCRYAHLAPAHQLAAVEKLTTHRTTNVAEPTDTTSDTKAKSHRLRLRGRSVRHAASAS